MVLRDQPNAGNTALAEPVALDYFLAERCVPADIHEEPVTPARLLSLWSIFALALAACAESSPPPRV